MLPCIIGKSFGASSDSEVHTADDTKYDAFKTGPTLVVEKTDPIDDNKAS
jgi:hypothetical protein